MPLIPRPYRHIAVTRIAIIQSTLVSRLRSTGEITRAKSRTSRDLILVLAQVLGKLLMDPASCKVPRRLE